MDACESYQTLHASVPANQGFEPPVADWQVAQNLSDYSMAQLWALHEQVTLPSIFMIIPANDDNATVTFNIPRGKALDFSNRNSIKMFNPTALSA